MEEYKLFFGDNFYPNGGYEDFIGIFQTLKSAKEYSEKQDQYSGKWAHIVVENKILVKGTWDKFYNDNKWEWIDEE